MATDAVAVRDVEISILDNLNGLLCLGGLGGFGVDASDGEDDEIVIEDGSLVRFEGQTWTATQTDEGGYWLFPGDGDGAGGAVVVEDASELKVPGPTRGATCPICMDE